MINTCLSSKKEGGKGTGGLVMIYYVKGYNKSAVKDVRDMWTIGYIREVSLWK